MEWPFKDAAGRCAWELLAFECVCAADQVPCKVPQLGGCLPVSHSSSREKGGLCNSGTLPDFHAVFIMPLKPHKMSKINQKNQRTLNNTPVYIALNRTP